MRQKQRYLKKENHKIQMIPQPEIKYIMPDQRTYTSRIERVNWFTRHENSDEIAKEELLKSIVSSSDFMNQIDFKHSRDNVTGNHVYQASISVIRGGING